MKKSITLSSTNKPCIYKSTLSDYLDQIKLRNEYREFLHIQKNAKKFPYAFCRSTNSEIVLWCSNDYLGMGSDPKVIKAAKMALDQHGLGAGGTRNISGTTTILVELEETLSILHNKKKALVFTSGYVANQNTLYALSKIFSDIIFLSDADNHASIIDGIRSCRSEKYIFNHNDIDSLKHQLTQIDSCKPKIIVFESVYSMDGSIAPIKEIVQIAKEYNALTYLDEVHAVGLYGNKGGGIAQMLNIEDEIDIVQGTLGKGFGGIGGYIAANTQIIEAIRLTAPGFIFTTALPPTIAAGVTTSINHLMHSSYQRDLHQKNLAFLKQELKRCNINFNSPSHIIPIMVGDPIRAQNISYRLLHEYKIYLQHINYPTVPKGKERLRIIVTPYHTIKQIRDFVAALKEVLYFF